MTDEEKVQKDLLLEEIKADVQSLIDNSQKENVKKEDLDKEVAGINEKIAKSLDNNEIKTLKESVDELIKASSDNSAAIKAFTEKVNVEKEAPKDLRSALKAAILTKKDLVLTEKNDDNGQRLSLKDYFTEKGNKQTPVFKVAVDMLESNIVQSNVATVRLTELDPNRVGIPLTVYPHVLDWIPSRGIAKPYMSVLVAYSYEDGVGTKTEGSAPGKSSFLLKTVEFKAFTIGTYFTLSDETLDDLDEALDEISIVAPDKIQDNVDEQVLGALGNDTTALAGLLTANKNTAFVPATYAGSVAGANLIDVFTKMKLSALANKYRPDTIILNPNTIDNIAAIKDQLDNSIMDRRIRFDDMGNPVAIAGMRIVAATELLIGKRREMTMEIGYNGTDLTEGQKTVVINIRIAFAVRDKAAVIYSSGLNAAKDVIDAGV
jgi:hypothetical protein